MRYIFAKDNGAILHRIIADDSLLPVSEVTLCGKEFTDFRIYVSRLESEIECSNCSSAVPLMDQLFFSFSNEDREVMFGSLFSAGSPPFLQEGKKDGRDR